MPKHHGQVGRHGEMRAALPKLSRARFRCFPRDEVHAHKHSAMDDRHSSRNGMTVPHGSAISTSS